MSQMPPINAHVLAEQLLNAQVEHTLNRFTGPDAVALLTQELDDLLKRAEHFLLEDVVSRESIYGVIHTYAFDLNLGAGVLELIGAMAQRLHEIARDDAPLLKHLMPKENMAQWIDKIVELQSLRQHLGQRLEHSQTAHNVFGQLISTMVHRQIPTWVDNLRDRIDQRLHQRTPKLLKRLIDQQQQLGEWLTQQLIDALQQQSARLVIQVDDDELRELLEQLWFACKNLPISSFSEGLEPIDIEEFFVLVYEDWRRLRHHPYVQRLICSGVDVFFDVYGDYTLVELLQEVGITRQHMVGEILRFAPPVLAALHKTGDLRELIRLQFEPFYQNPNTIAILTQALDSNNQ